MTAHRSSFECLINSVENCIQEAELLKLSETAALLRMVKLDIVTRTNGISAGELDIFLFALESELRVVEHIKPPELFSKSSNQKQWGKDEM